MAYRASAKVLPIRLTLGSVVTAGYEFNATIAISSAQLHKDGIYTGEDVAVDDYIATSQAGRVLRISSISAQDANSVTCVLQDTLRSNSQTSGLAEITEDEGVLFEVHNGKPILYPLPAMPRGALLNNWASEIYSRFDYYDQQRTFTPPGTYASLSVGDLLGYNSGYVLLQGDLIHIGTVIEKYTDNTIRVLPTGPLIDKALGGSNGDIFYLDQSNNGKLTTTKPSTGRVEFAYFQVSASQAIYLGGATPWSGVAEFVDLSTAQNIGGDKTFDNNVVITGNFTVNGTTTTVDSTNTTISDKLIELGTGRTGTPSGDAGLVIERGDQNNIFIGYDESTDEITLSQGSFTGASTGDLTLTDVPIRLGNDVRIANSNSANVKHEMHVLYGETGNATPKILERDAGGTSNSRVYIATDTTAMFEADVVGRNQAGNEHCAYRLKGLINNTGGNTILIGTVAEEIIAESDVNWVATATANNIANSLDITVTGDTNNIRWSAFVKLTVAVF
jgi:hypothetical protein|tara:strand:+ start:5379 stop:6890 length:1512 start_codon:yes stop_codon:yes gene_type:complete